MNTKLIIAMGATAVVTTITSKILIAFGKTDLAQMIDIGGMSLIGCQAIGLVATALTKASSLIR